jgi:plasmid maintenance system antidote protein VapI
MTHHQDDEGRATATAHDPSHPGEVLAEEFLISLGISQNRLAKAIDVAPRAVTCCTSEVRG